MIAPSTDSTCWNPVERAWERAGAAPNVLFRTDDNLAVHRLVCAGLGHAVLADLAIEPLTGADEVAVVPLEHVPARQIGLRWSRGRRLGPAAQAFVETASALYDVHPVA
jgi:DNA-binding transcriptional LysR family regulator